MKTKYTTDEIKAIVDGTGIDVSAITDVDQYEVGRYYYDETTHEEKFRPYTMDEINAIIDRAEADIAAGRGIPDEEVWREMEKNLMHAMVEKSERQLASGKWQDSETMMRKLRNKYAKIESIFWDCRQNPQKILKLIMDEEKHLDI